ncbi:type II toxin-antitoxin system antitoxin SocA domain-containing protein [Jejuia pallidilutea]|uniref:Prophage ps3 protein 01 n=1 Tax=Jejuia pallidilutea TaxID=504487 RepID=A0A090VYJ8_9FLAO|nr:type II toxin-antitoxin system antitoxin SocA domain-containing protein [Jejuia pallidilutea]GAL68324.1 prophage ps3 protein 01 [Jejuia pallidilutea]GAL70201.1 prophage ps3 protein 01 [Jejuia pallidilutea]GAL88842.1 prophage ps3 protein 01 [Jejuia pallidilutea]
MKSPFTGKEMTLKIEKSILVFRKEEFKYNHKSYYCEDSGEAFTTTELDEFNLNQVYNQYRDKHNIPFPDEIKEFRAKYNFSYADITKILGLGVNSYRNYEKGEVPSLANAALLKAVINSNSTLKSLIKSNNDITDTKRNTFLKTIAKVKKQDELNKRKQELVEYVFNYNLLPDNFSGYRKPNFDKLVEMVVFFTERVKATPTKMNKLLFYADFLNYKLTGVSISGTRYFAHTHGPVPEKFRTLFDYLANEQMVDLISVQYPSGLVGEEFAKNPNKTFENTLFKASELDILNSIATKFEKHNASEIRALSHEEKAWIENEKQKALIDYNYSFELIHA